MSNDCKYTRTKPPARKKNKAGAKGYYQPWMAAEATELVGKLGARMIDLADYFEVCIATIEYWQRTKPEFARALKKGKLQKSLVLSQAMYQKAIGYSHPDVHIIPNRVKIYDEEGRVIEERTEALKVPIIKHYPPDAYAANKMLAILMKEVWAEPNQYTHNINVQANIDVKKVEELSMEDLTDEMKEMLFQLNLKQLSAPQNN